MNSSASLPIVKPHYGHIGGARCEDSRTPLRVAVCGIVGLFAKSGKIEGKLGEHLAAMLAQLSDRGPDSAGVAVYLGGFGEMASET